MKYVRLWFKNFAMEASADLAYKWNFFIKFFAVMLSDIVGPIVAILIYATGFEIPGWTLYQFIFFQGTLYIVFGLGHALAVGMPVKVISDVREGNFDKVLTKPYNPLLYMWATAVDLDGFAEVLVGIVLVIVAALAMKVGFGWNVLGYIILIALATLLQFALMTLISAMAFLVVQSFALFDILFSLSTFARYPLSIFSLGFKFSLTFIFPIAISANWPVEVFLKGFGAINWLAVVLPVLGFTALSIWLWNLAMKKHTSAGG